MTLLSKRQKSGRVFRIFWPSHNILTLPRNFLDYIMCNIIFPENRSTDNGQMNFFNNCVHFMAEWAHYRSAHSHCVVTRVVKIKVFTVQCSGLFLFLYTYFRKRNKFELILNQSNYFDKKTTITNKEMICSSVGFTNILTLWIWKLNFFLYIHST